MKSLSQLLLALLMLATIVASAQTIPPGTFKHIVIIVQENRTPDQLFGAGPNNNCTAENPFETGVDVVNGGPAKGKGTQCNVSLPLNVTNDPNHEYIAGWLPDYDSGAQDGFCQIVKNGVCLQYSYVQQSDVQPYFDLASAYGWANYMFQTNEGPSFPAHQFLFTGTSAPVAPKQAGGLDFVAENPPGGKSGCPYGATPPSPPGWVGPRGIQTAQNRPECYTHDSLVTDANGDKGFSWRYYSPSTGVIWDAPQSIPEVCYGANSLANLGQACSGTEWSSHLSFPGTLKGQGAPIFNDIASCNLPEITWVIPDDVWSDHAGHTGPAYGPSWVGDIVNAIGNSYAKSLGQCDYWGTYSTNPEPTAIFVVWDDWGGWYDHVAPPAVYRSNSPKSCTRSDAPHGWGCGYIYGFRVPLLVVSEYTPAGYVSGPCTGNCPNSVFPYVHDFGSILAFTEYNFGMPSIAPPYYADFNAPDGANGHVPLSDFFGSGTRTFTTISTPYPSSFFQDYYADQHAKPSGPDADDGDED
jgi:phospholipase C